MNIVRNVGNEDIVSGAIGGAFDDDDEEIRRAIEESLKMSP